MRDTPEVALKVFTLYTEARHVRYAARCMDGLGYPEDAADAAELRRIANRMDARRRRLWKQPDFIAYTAAFSPDDLRYLGAPKRP